MHIIDPPFFVAKGGADKICWVVVVVVQRGVCRILNCLG